MRLNSVNTKRLGQILFSIALALIVFLGIFEFIERRSKTNSEANRCEINPVFNNWPKNERILYVARDLVVSVNDENGIIRKLKWRVDGSQFVSQIEDEVKVFCEAPGYNCFMPTLRDSKLDWRLLYFKPPFGIAKVKYGKNEKTFPLYWDGKQDLKVGAPIQLCNRSLSNPSFKLSVLANRLFVYEEQNHFLANFDLSSMNGASPMSAPREPDELMTVSSSGRLSTTTCNEMRPSTQSLLWVPNKDSFVFLSPNDSLMWYRYDRALIPTFLDLKQPIWVIGMLNGFVVIEKDRLVTLIGTEKSIKSVPGIGELFKKDSWDANYFVWNDLNRLVTVDLHSWLSIQKVRIIDLANRELKLEQISKGFDWSSRQGAFNTAISNENKNLYLWEQNQNGTLSIDAVSCH